MTKSGRSARISSAPAKLLLAPAPDLKDAKALLDELT
jgi:hypothetical protein